MSKKTKILTSSLILILGAILLSGASCSKETAAPVSETEEEASGSETPATEPSSSEKEVDIGKMNDDLYIEIQAQMGYRVGRDDLYADWVSGGYEKFLASKGVTEAQFTAYANKILDDPNPYWKTEIMDKIGKRVEELEKQ